MRVYTHSGREFERFFLGDPTKGRIERVRHFMPRDKAIQYVIENQSNFCWNPGMPNTYMAKLLLLRIRNNLGENFRKSTLLYNALGTTLDIHWGVDCFIKLHGTILTIDLSLLDKKPQHLFKADVLVNGDDARHDFYRIAEIIAKKLMRLHFYPTQK